MKKFLILLSAVTLTVGAMAQGNGKGKGQDKHNKSNKHNKKANADYNRDRVYDGDRNSNGSTTGKYTNNAPRKVRDAFARDYPNASNVSWTKDQGVWTAHFNGGGLFGGGNSVSYRANGAAVGTNNTVNRRNGERTTQRSGTSVWDKVFRRQ